MLRLRIGSGGEKQMISPTVTNMAAIIAAGALVACGGNEAGLGSTSEAAKAGGAKTQDAKLNLSHIECTQNGDVLVHFVLLFAGSAQPAALNGTWNDGTTDRAFGPAAAYKNSGNVWHYEVFLPAGFIDIVGASVGAVTLHNPYEYGGDYGQCGTGDVCELEVAAQALVCPGVALGNEGSECAFFGLLPLGKDDQLTGLTFAATMDAFVALVKSGSGGCDSHSAYRVYVDVEAGDTLETPAGQDISHVTYCDCAEAPAE